MKRRRPARATISWCDATWRWPWAGWAIGARCPPCGRRWPHRRRRAMTPRPHDRGAAPVLFQMLDGQRLAGMDALTPEQREEAILQAIDAAPYLSDPGLRAALHRLRENDPALRVREAARAALEREQP